MIPIGKLNRATPNEFITLTGGTLEGETWLAERVVQHRPFADAAAIIDAFRTEIEAATPDEKVRLLASHPPLGIAVDETLSAASASEQASAGLDQLTPDEYETFHTLNTRYTEKFGFPFVICAREHDKHSILHAFRERLQHSRDAEIDTGSREVIAIIRLRLLDLVQPTD